MGHWPSHYMSKKELSNELNNWFKSADTSNKNFWNKDPVARIIKENLINWGHFKQICGGNPKKGYRKMQEHFARQNGYQGDFSED